jgi:carbonic anhydrase
MSDFDDLLAANRAYADDFKLGGFDGVARSGVAIVTCMDSRIDPLGMIGLATLLKVDRVLVIEHTRCAMASATEDELRARVGSEVGTDASWMSLGVIDNQLAALRGDVAKIRSHPLIGDHVLAGGFLYDVDTGLLEPVV